MYAFTASNEHIKELQQKCRIGNDETNISGGLGRPYVMMYQGTQRFVLYYSWRTENILKLGMQTVRISTKVALLLRITISMLFTINTYLKKNLEDNNFIILYYIS